MHVGVVSHRRTPSVQDQRDADGAAEVFRVGSDRRERFRCHLEQQSVDHCLIGVGQVGAVAKLPYR